VNAAVAGDMMPVNGQAKTHTDNLEKAPEPEVAEEALENGPKGKGWHACSSSKCLRQGEFLTAVGVHKCGVLFHSKSELE
jgi:hypothetical protein